MSVTVSHPAWVQVTLDTAPPGLTFDAELGLLSTTEPLVSVTAVLLDAAGNPTPVGAEPDGAGRWVVVAPRGAAGALVIEAIDAAGNRATLLHGVDALGPSAWTVRADTEHLLLLQPYAYPVYRLEASHAHA